MFRKKKWRKLKRQLRTLGMALLGAVNQFGVWTKHKLNMAHTISRERANFLEKHFSGFGFEESTPDKSLFDTITSPAELHYLAHIYNWDNGPEVLSWIINSPNCDRGTAALIFWHSQPDFYQEYTNESEMSLQGGVLPLLQSIMRNWERGFYQQQIAYDRHEDPAAGKLYPDNPREKWPVPDYMLVPTKGKPFLFA